MKRKKLIWRAILRLCVILLALSIVWNKKNKSPKTDVEAETAALESTQAAEAALEGIVIVNEEDEPKTGRIQKITNILKRKGRDEDVLSKLRE